MISEFIGEFILAIIIGFIASGVVCVGLFAYHEVKDRNMRL
jgi:formate/nitrite transporter FocA (FNT family)